MRAALLALYRVRTAFFWIGLGTPAVIGVAQAPLRMLMSREVLLILVAIAGVVLLVGLVLTWVGPLLLPTRAPLTLHSPVRGTWLALNSPASKIPSHGVRMYGQSHAVDLVADDGSGARPTFGDGPAMRRNEDFPAFGAPLLAMCDGVVVRASDWRRDHRARSSWLGYAYMMIESMLRELGGSGFVIGNHVTIEHDGTFVTVAHVQRGSLRVQVGDRVQAGDVIGRCGNSGNSSEPHVHAQVSDRASFRLAQGVPFVFRDVRLQRDDESWSDAADTMPANNQRMDA